MWWSLPLVGWYRNLAALPGEASGMLIVLVQDTLDKLEFETVGLIVNTICTEAVGTTGTGGSSAAAPSTFSSGGGDGPRQAWNRRGNKSQNMSLELGCTLNDGDIIEIFQAGHRHWAIYVGDGNIVHMTGSIVGSGDDSVHGNSIVVEKSTLEAEAKGCGFKLNNIYNGDLIPILKEEVVRSALGIVGESKPYGSCCKNFVLELKYGKANLDIIIRNLMPIPGEIAVVAAKGVKVTGTAISSNSDVVGSFAAKGVDLAGQGLTAMSDTVGTVAGKGVAAFGNVLSIGAQTLAPIIAAKADALSAGSGTMVLTAADCIAPLAESLSGDAQEATAQSIMQLGSSVSSSSAAVGSAVSSGLSWLGSASAAGASSLLGYFKSGAEPINQTDEKPNILEVSEEDTCNKPE
ncbi:uncharacterized protein LOC130277736 [Hyla sarda]|uniref:uncharacterized protein LOC130277736 n=1 Tax=Hyla sarda TaxID=327740 RepID=UPI0024C3A7B3|nr:uncharacterized protein LOC130277736 [Hyla sarda]